MVLYSVHDESLAAATLLLGMGHCPQACALRTRSNIIAPGHSVSSSSHSCSPSDLLFSLPFHVFQEIATVYLGRTGL